MSRPATVPLHLALPDRYQHSAGSKASACKYIYNAVSSMHANSHQCFPTDYRVLQTHSRAYTSYTLMPVKRSQQHRSTYEGSVVVSHTCGRQLMTGASSAPLPLPLPSGLLWLHWAIQLMAHSNDTCDFSKVSPGQAESSMFIWLCSWGNSDCSCCSSCCASVMTSCSTGKPTMHRHQHTQQSLTARTQITIFNKTDTLLRAFFRSQ